MNYIVLQIWSHIVQALVQLKKWIFAIETLILKWITIIFIKVIDICKIGSPYNIQNLLLPISIVIVMQRKDSRHFHKSEYDDCI
jgi:hypothetical protein